MLAALVFLRCLCWVALATDNATIHTAFLDFVAKYNRTYQGEEWDMRFARFQTNYAKMEAHNALSLSWKMGITPFSDMTSSEALKQFGGGFHSQTANTEQPHDTTCLTDLEVKDIEPRLVTTIDWVAAGAVSPVVDQLHCFSCYAFSAIDAVESALRIYNNQDILLSQQQVVDCSFVTGNHRCSGGLMDSAFSWIVFNKGIGSRASYPYLAHDQTCKVVPSVANISGYRRVTRGSESALLQALALQPISVGVSSFEDNWLFYASGILTTACVQNANHAVILVGAGTDAVTGLDYWTLKNEWGTGWGMGGYIKMQRGRNLCSISNWASYPVL